MGFTIGGMQQAGQPLKRFMIFRGLGEVGWTMAGKADDARFLHGGANGGDALGYAV